MAEEILKSGNPLYPAGVEVNEGAEEEKDESPSGGKLYPTGIEVNNKLDFDYVYSEVVRIISQQSNQRYYCQLLECKESGEVLYQKVPTIEGAIETTYQTKWVIENGTVSVDIIHSAPITKVVTNSGGQLFPTGVEIDETEEEETN